MFHEYINFAGTRRALSFLCWRPRSLHTPEHELRNRLECYGSYSRQLRCHNYRLGRNCHSNHHSKRYVVGHGHSPDLEMWLQSLHVSDYVAMLTIVHALCGSSLCLRTLPTTIPLGKDLLPRPSQSWPIGVYDDFSVYQSSYHWCSIDRFNLYVDLQTLHIADDG